MEQPTVPVICSCGYDGKLTSPLCPLHGKHGLGAQVDRLRAVNAKLVEALENYAPADSECDTGHIPDEGTIDYCRFCREWSQARAAIEANK